jgi:hypothetical protein
MPNVPLAIADALDRRGIAGKIRVGIAESAVAGDHVRPAGFDAGIAAIPVHVAGAQIHDSAPRCLPVIHDIGRGWLSARESRSEHQRAEKISHRPVLVSDRDAKLAAVCNVARDAEDTRRAVRRPRRAQHPAPDRTPRAAVHGGTKS